MFNIALAGYARAGKDTVVSRLVQYHGFTKIAFADPLREFVLAVDPAVGITEVDVLNDRGYWEKQYVLLRYSEVLDKVGYELAKELYPEVRNILQKIGTEGARQTFWDDFWVDLAEKRANEIGGPIAFSDCRFPNEAEMVSRNGFVVRVDRPSVGPESGHDSENSLSDWEFDYVLDNSGTLEELEERIDFMVGVLSNRWETASTDDQR